MVTDIYLLLMLFSLLALVIFFFSMLIRLIKGEDWKEEGKRSLSSSFLPAYSLYCLA